MSTLTYVDTNVLVYLSDPASAKKHQRAREVLSGEEETGGFTISTSTLSELYRALTRGKGRPPLLSLADAERTVRRFERMNVALVTVEDLNEAMRRTQAHRRSYFDALHDAVALRSGCKRFLTEDLPGGRRTIQGVLYENPFAGL
jgi:predicted nucleic acid-binding protein